MEVMQDGFAGAGGTPIHTIGKTVDKTRADVVIIHGYAEHSGRYGHVIDALNDAGYSAHALDHRGHGRSGDTLGFVDDFDNLVTDVETFIDVVRTASAGEPRPLFLLGHSMGALATLCVLARRKVAEDGAILSGAPLVPTVKIPGVVLSLSSVLSLVAPKLPALRIRARK